MLFSKQQQHNDDTMTTAVIARGDSASSSSCTLSSQYKCCCGCLHVCTGAIIIGILELVGVLANAGGLILNYKNGDFDTNTKKLVGGLTGAVVTVIVVMLMFHGMWKEKPRYVVPHLIFQAIGIAALFVGGVVALVEFLEGKNAVLAAAATEINDQTMMVTATSGETVITAAAEENAPGEIFLIYTLATIVILVASSVVEVWFFSVIYRFFRFLKQKQQQETQQLVEI